MAEIKTKATTQSVADFLNTIQPEQKKQDGLALLDMFQKITGEKPVMWGNNMIGFGQYRYKSERSTQEGDWPLTAFSPRKQNLTVYLMAGFQNNQDLLSKLGKHKISGGSCLYINKLSDVDQGVLGKLINQSYMEMRTTHGKSA